MAQYTYSSLQPSNFRFLILLPGDGDDIVNCLLQESSIRQPNSEYEALSYVWGDDKKPHLVLCEGKELAVTTSLWTALRRLRLPQEHRTLWADAICINQADLGERADQVQLMRQIYDGAARVIIWLGEETDVMRRAFPLIDQFTISVSEYLDEVPDVYTPAVKHWVMERGRATFDSENQIVLQHFFENPWFLRAWVFQEAVCAKSAIVQCGGLQIDFEILELFATLFFVNELTTILPTAESRGSHHQLYAIRNVRRLYARGEKHTIFRLLAGSAGAGAKDPRDQLFSLAGIAAGQPLPYPPNYTQDVISWYRDFSAHALRTEPGMVALEECFLCPDRLPGLPSWARDWTGSRYVPFPGNNPKRIFDADGKKESVQQLMFDDNTLTLHGCVVDRIARVGNDGYPRIISNIDESQEEARDRRSEVHVDMVKEGVILAKEVTLHAFNTEALWQALWRTLLGDQIQQQNLQNNRVDQSYEEMVAHLKPLVIGSEGDLDMTLLRENNPRRMEFNNSIQRVSFQRRFCVTHGGRLGWVPRHAQEGDAIAIIAGIGVPMALRSKMTDYEVLGNCYVHGIMDGEMADSDRLGRELLHLV